jgi:hypothetical protein
MDARLIIIFFSLLAGLGVSDLITSLHRLLRIRDQIKWHWLPLIYIFVAFQGLLILAKFVFDSQDSTTILTSIGFLFWLLPIIMIQFIMLAVLPDEEPQKGFNLLEWYFEQRKYFFSLLILFVLFLVLNRVIFGFESEFALAPAVLIIPFLILIFTKKYWIHSSLSVLMLLYLAFSLYIQTAGL